MSLADAAYALDEQTAGRTPDHHRLLAGAIALDTLTREGDADRDILDAAAGLKLVAEGGALVLDSSAICRGRIGSVEIIPIAQCEIMRPRVAVDNEQARADTASVSGVHVGLHNGVSWCVPAASPSRAALRAPASRL
jgi:hypothetical protein